MFSIVELGFLVEPVHCDLAAVFQLLSRELSGENMILDNVLIINII